MATWTSIADATLEPGKPIRAIDGRALRDNPIAIAEGAAGAPKIETAGITDLNVTTAKLAAGAVTTAKITNRNLIGLHAARITDAEIPVLTVSAADTYDIGFGATQVAGTTSTSSTSFVTARTITIVRVTGAVRFRASHRADSGGFNPNVEMQILKNGSLQASWITSSTIDVVRSADISVVPGDVIVWQHRIFSGSGFTFFTPGLATASNGYTTAPLFIASTDL